MSVTVTADGSLEAVAVRGQGSNLLYSMALANGLAIVEDGPGVAPGGRVRVLLLDDPGAVALPAGAAGDAGRRGLLSRSPSGRSQSNRSGSVSTISDQ